MNYPLFLANRLSLSSRGKKNAPAVTVAIISTALSVAVMIASIAIVLGFKKEIRDKIVGFNGHLSLFIVPLNQEEDNLLTFTPSLNSELESLPFIKEASLQAAIPAVMKTTDDFKGVYLKALKGENTSNFLMKNLDEGEIPDYSIEENRNKILISRKAANQLYLKEGDKIDTYFISDEVRVRRLEVNGIFNSHFEQYDDVMIFGDLGLVQQLGKLGANQGTYLQLITDDFNKISDYTYQLQGSLNEALAEGRLYRQYRTENVLSQGAGFFSWLSLLDTNVAVIITLMIIVGCVTLVSGMLILILEKKRFIGIMRALGTPTKKIRKVFVFLAIKIAILGLIIGNMFSLIFLYCQQKYHFLPLDPDSYYIDFVPVNINWESFLFLNMGVIFIIYLVLVLPSRFVSGISPTEIMRYE